MELPDGTQPPILDHMIIMAPAERVEELRAVLARAGLTESCRRRHVGNGTSSFFYCFDNCFLELLWVCDRDEAQNGPANDLRTPDRCESDDPAILPYAIALRNAPDGNGTLPFAAFEYQPEDDAQGPKLVAEVSRDLSQPLIFRALRARPPIDWTDGLQGERQSPGGYAEVAEWRLELPQGHRVGPELRLLIEAGLLTVSEAPSNRPGLSAVLRRTDGRLELLQLPDPRSKAA